MVSSVADSLCRSVILEADIMEVCRQLSVCIGKEHWNVECLRMMS